MRMRWAVAAAGAWALGCWAAGSAAGQAADEPVSPDVTHWVIATTESPNYDKATAGDPLFADKTLWPNVTGAEAYVKQTWPAGRTLVWAHPGQEGGARGLDPLDPANWTDAATGRPATDLFDENTDMVLPPSDRAYAVNLRGPGHGHSTYPQVFRHVTVGRNANYLGGGDGVGRKIYGSLWLKRGGKMHCQGATAFLGGAHTFVRNDNTEGPDKATNCVNMSQYFTFNKEGSSSVEMLGHVRMLDEFRVHAGTAIVGPNSRLETGRNASPTVHRDGTIAILDGGYFGSWTNNFGGVDLMVNGGTVQGGLADRPLARDAYLGIHFKNHTQASWKPDQTIERRPALVLQAGSTLRAYTKDPAKARLVVTFAGERGSLYYAAARSDAEEARLAALTDPKGKEAYEKYKWYYSLPRGLSIWMAGDVAVENVEFDWLRKGGLMLQSPAARSGWKNVTFGPHGLGTPDELISELGQLDRSSQY